MKYCKKCIMPDTRPDQIFNEKGVCNACLSFEENQKIKFDDKTLHRSKLIRYFYEKDYPIKKTQKELESIYKKIKRNKNYFYSAKDIAVLESLESDGITIPKEINHKGLSENYNIPDSLNDLAEKGEKGYLALKIVEIIGEDEVNNLDPETIYFITNLLNKLDLKEFRNEFDWFSGTLYALIFIISCGLIWIFIFGIYYLIIGELY